MLDRADKDSTILFIGSAGRLVELAEQKGINVCVLTFLDSFFFLLAVPKVCSLMRIHKPDIIHLHSTNASIVGRISSFFTSAKVVYTIHGWHFLNHKLSPLLNWLIVSIERMLMKSVDAWIIISKFDYSAGVEKNLLDENLTHFIPNGVPEIIPEPYHFSLPLIDDVFKIVFVGRACEQKNPIEAVRVIERLEKNFHLTMFLSGENVEGYIHEINKSPASERVTIVQNEPDASRFLASFDLLIMTSRYEGMPLVILEAMSLGLPVIATDVCGLSEVVAEGESGYLVECGHPELMAEKIASLYRDPIKTQKISSEAKRRYYDSHTAKTMVDKTFDVYSNLVDTN